MAGGQYHGVGKYTSANSDEYEGEWRYDKMDGHGRYIYKDSGDMYEGNFINGICEGAGEYTSAATGKTVKGKWVAGKLESAPQVQSTPVKTMYSAPIGKMAKSMPTCIHGAGRVELAAPGEAAHTEEDSSIPRSVPRQAHLSPSLSPLSWFFQHRAFKSGSPGAFRRGRWRVRHPFDVDL